MVAHKAAAVERFLKAPDPSSRAFLFYGTDAGLVTLRGAALASKLAKSQGDAEIIRLDDRDLAEDPSRLEVELRTLPMFASGKVVRVTAGSRLDVPGLKSLFETPLDVPLIVEAGNLRPDSALRKLFESNRQAAALPCYADERSLAALVDAELGETGARIGQDAKAYLMTRLGADQALSKSEIEKLAIYAGEGGEVTHEAVDAIVGDSAEIAIENFVYAVSGGDTRDALHQLDRLISSGVDPSAALSGLARHVLQLHSLAAAIGAGAAADQALKSLRPRPHFKREAAFIGHASRWGAERLLNALPAIQATVQRSRRMPELERDFAERLVLALHHKG
jgi:DNA polymerase-3 subunit delta